MSVCVCDKNFVASVTRELIKKFNKILYLELSKQSDVYKFLVGDTKYKVS